MSRTVEGWSHLDEHWNPAREYYLSHTLDGCKPETTRGMAAAFLVIAGLISVALLIATFGASGGARTAILYVGGVVSIATLAFFGIGGLFAAERVEALLAQDDAQGRTVREPLARRVRYFAELQEQYKGLMQHSVAEARTRRGPLYAWVIEAGGYYAVRDQWPEDFKEYAKLLSEPHYQAVVSVFYPVTSAGKEIGPGEAPFEKIMEHRKRIYEWATRETTPEERAKARIARSEFIDTEEELAKRRVQDIADSLRKPSVPSSVEDV